MKTKSFTLKARDPQILKPTFEPEFKKEEAAELNKLGENLIADEVIKTLGWREMLQIASYRESPEGTTNSSEQARRRMAT